MNPRFGAWLLSAMSLGRGHTADNHDVILRTVYGSDIAARLKHIHGFAERDEGNAWLVAALRGRDAGYIHCRFQDRDILTCEAVAGPYPPRRGQGAALPPAIAEQLKDAGYWPDADGRPVFKYEITNDSCVWGGASWVIMEPLIKVFGARLLSKIDIVAPLAPRRDEAAIRRMMYE